MIQKQRFKCLWKLYTDFVIFMKRRNNKIFLLSLSKHSYSTNGFWFPDIRSVMFFDVDIDLLLPNLNSTYTHLQGRHSLRLTCRLDPDQGRVGTLAVWATILLATFNEGEY